MKIESYQTATGEAPDELDDKVNALIKQGFQPYGSPYVAPKEEGFGAPICQAMVKTDG
jgi:hypothetical protein